MFRINLGYTEIYGEYTENILRYTDTEIYGDILRIYWGYTGIY